MGSVHTVTQVTRYIKGLITQDFVLRKVSVKGEISNCKYHSSGHIYFTLKDENSAIFGAMFANYRSTGLKFQLKDGMKVVVTGKIDLYERDGRYQIIAEKIEQEGMGELYLRFLQLKEELEEMGMFAMEYKKPIPRYARRIGVVTSPTGAAIQDIRNVSARRNPYVQIYLYPALVQGDMAASTIVSGIQCLDRMNLDVILVCRGGGSIEDLWAFNEESVARAIFECNTPIISGVGHEIDFTIADFVADHRAPTPSAAAELAVFDYEVWEQTLKNYEMSIQRLMDNKMSFCRERLTSYINLFKYLNPVETYHEQCRKVLDYEKLLNQSMKKVIERKRHELAIRSERLNGESPLRRISAGYAYVSDEHGNTIKSVEQIHPEDVVTLAVADGRAKAKIIEIERVRDYGKAGDN
ncbi:MAG: exodeoxyribonuclease VII large subunit [Lachnospiraceae bacterium]